MGETTVNCAAYVIMILLLTLLCKDVNIVVLI